MNLEVEVQRIAVLFYFNKYGSMKFLEKELEEIIFNSSSEELFKRGIHLDGKCYRQLKIGNYGVADLVYARKYAHDIGEPYLHINVCELKKDKAGISAFLQALKYVKGIMCYLDIRGIDYRFSITLIAPEIDTSSDYIYLTDLIDNDHSETVKLLSVDNYSVKYDINGMYFKKEYDYFLTENGFHL